MEWVVAIAGLVILLALAIVASRRTAKPPAQQDQPSNGGASEERKLISLAPPPLEELSSPDIPAPISLFESHFGDESELTMTFPRFAVFNAARTHVGLKRPSNEDNLLCLEEAGVFAVADGMGGEAAGEIASRLALETLEREMTSANQSVPPMPGMPSRAEQLVRAVVAADASVGEETRRRPELRGMGTTLVALRFAPTKNVVYGAHVGDSRAYRLRGRELSRLTQDHTLGRIVGAQGGASSRLAWALGTGDARPEAFSETPQLDDVYLLCSDGLTKMVDDQRIGEILAASDDLAECADALIAEANANGGHDNVTVILVRVAPAQS